MLGLVVEGGANRTYYSIGVMDAFIENGIDVDLVVGVSAGIANAGSYVSKQKGRCFELGLKYLPDKRYMGLRYFFKKGNGSYFNRDFVFNRIKRFAYGTKGSYFYIFGKVYGSNANFAHTVAVCQGVAQTVYKFGSGLTNGTTARN